jgi:hypothetical protein
MKKSNPSSNQGRKRANGKNQANRTVARALPGTRNQMVVAPASQQRIRVNPPKVTNQTLPNGNRLIRFEEYVQDIITSSTTLAFSVQRFQVQPGISSLFAWLADQAINYQEYVVRRLSFRFETDQQTAIAGKVMYAFSPDAADPLPVNKQEMLEYGVKGKSAVWQEFTMPVPLSEAPNRMRYIRSGNLSANLDIKTYDFGALFVATSGVVATSANIGELYVEYELELRVPVVQSLAQAQARSLTITSGGTVAEGTPFGDASTLLGGLDVTVNAGVALTFNRVGNYLVTMDIVGTGLNTVYSPTGTLSSGTITTIPGISNAAANVGTEARVAFVLVVNARGASFNPTLSPQGTTITGTVTRIATYSAV